MSRFVHLHVHTQYSILDGQASIQRLVDKAIADRQPGIAITDHGNMFGVKEFFNYVKKVTGKYKGAAAEAEARIAGLRDGSIAAEDPAAEIAAEEQKAAEARRKAAFKPIIGCEVYVAPRGRTRFQKVHEFDSHYNHLVLLCRNEEGYRNLSYMVSKAYLEGFYVKPRIDMDLLRAHAAGLIACSACLGGEVPRLLLAGDYDKAREAALEMGRTTSRTATESAEALEYMALAGWSVEDSIAGLPGILRMSEATGLDLARVSDLVTDSMSALGVGIQDLGGYLDVAAKANNKSNPAGLCFEPIL